MSVATVELLTGPDFRISLIVGLILAGVMVTMYFLARRRRHLAVGGLALSIGTAVVFSMRREVTWHLVGGLAALAAAGALPFPIRTRSLLGLPGAGLIASVAGPADSGAMQLFIVAAIPTLGALVSTFDATSPSRHIGLSLLAVASVGTFFTVPDTEHALIFMGVALPLGLLGWPATYARIGSAGAFAAMGLFIWVIARDGAGRPTAMAAATATIGLLATEPLRRLLAGRRLDVATATEGSALPPLALLLLQFGIVVVASRIAATMSSLWATMAVAAAVNLLAVGISAIPLGREVDLEDRLSG